MQVRRFLWIGVCCLILSRFTAPAWAGPSSPDSTQGPPHSDFQIANDPDIETSPTPTPPLNPAQIGTAPLPPNLIMSGEVALRYERDLNQPVKADRIRYRNRLGWVYTPQNGWTYGLHLRTGNPFFQNSTWTTIDHNQVDGVWPDEAYIQYRPPDHPGWRFDAGEFTRPWRSNPVYTGAVWSSAMKAGGFNASYTDPDNRWWITVGPWIAMPQDSGRFGDFQVTAVQAGRVIKLGHKQRLEASLGLLYFGFDKNGEGALLARNRGNAVITENGKPVAFASGYNIIDPRLDYYFGSIKGIPMTASVEYFDNVAPSAPGVSINGKTGFLVGWAAGEARYPGRCSFRLQYFKVGQDAVFSPITQGDFVQATNYDGFYANLTVPITARLNVGFVLERTDQSAVNPVENRTAFDIYYRY